MMPRSTTSSVAGRSTAIRRMRRRASAASRLYCSTNGCTSFLEIDTAAGVARCHVCGLVRRIH
jgi:hypothetical protein